MKKILIAVMLTMTLQASDTMCKQNLRDNIKYLNKADRSEGDTKILYIEMAIRENLVAKFSCGESSRAEIQENIDMLSAYLKTLKENK